MSTGTLVRRDFPQMTDAERAALIDASFAHFCQGLHVASAADLQHEADRIESQRPSELVFKMRAQINAVRDLRRAYGLLTKLGNDADAIADRLRAKGIKGARVLSNICPLAIYLETQGVTAYVSAESLSVPVDEHTTVDMPVPPAVAVFVPRFDGGVYLDLIDTSLVGDEATDGVTF